MCGKSGEHLKCQARHFTADILQLNVSLSQVNNVRLLLDEVSVTASPQLQDLYQAHSVIA